MMQSVVAAAQDVPLEQAQYERVVNGMRAIQDIGADLNQWALLVLGGTLAVMLSTSYRKPAWPYRAIYVLLLPSLALLGWALQQGSYIRRVYGAMVARPPTRDAALAALTGANAALETQLWAFQAAVFILAVWLVCYMTWWIFIDKTVVTESKKEE